MNNHQVYGYKDSMKDFEMIQKQSEFVTKAEFSPNIQIGGEKDISYEIDSDGDFLPSSSKSSNLMSRNIAESKVVCRLPSSCRPKSARLRSSKERQRPHYDLLDSARAEIDDGIRKQEQDTRRYTPTKPITNGVQGIQTLKADQELLSHSSTRPTSAPARQIKCKISVPEAAQQSQTTPTTKKPFSSRQYLINAAMKKRMDDQEFAQQLLNEQLDQERMIKLKISQGNKFLQDLKMIKTYHAKNKQNGELLVYIVEPGQHDRSMSVDSFLREYEKLVALHKEYVIQQRRTTRESEANPSESTKNSNHLNGKGRIKMTKNEVQEELRGVLKSTIELTSRLEEQLNELKQKGWNSTFLAQSGYMEKK